MSQYFIDNNNVVKRNLQSSVEECIKQIEILKNKPTLEIVIVDELPETGEAGILYLVPSQDAESGNIYEEYIWLEDEETFELVGSASIDLSNYVTLDGEQEITAKKTFTTDQDLGDNTLADSPKLGFISTDASNQGNWYLFVNQNQNNFNICQLNGNNYVGIKMTRSGVYPTNTNYTSLGAGSMRFKELYLRSADSYNTYGIDFGNNAKIYEDTSNRIAIRVNSTDKLKIGASETLSANKLSPDSSGIDLGREALRWGDLYLEGSLKDGNGASVAVADIVAKPDYDNPNVWASGKLASGTGSATIDCSDATGVGKPEWGLYMFTYGNAQCYVAFTQAMWNYMLAGYPIRVACPCLEEAGGTVEGNTGNLKIEKTSTTDVIKVTVASTITGSATSTNGWDFQFIKVI